jgi:hypothetical protein
MNDRIRTLAVQSGLEIPADTEYNGHVYRHALEKFAELIVKECAKRVDYWESRQGEHTEDLLKHFGVKQ